MTALTQARVLPPGNRPSTTTKVNGTSYTAALGAYKDVPYYDAIQLAANGWAQVAQGSSTTTGRPTVNIGGQPLPVGFDILDTTLGYVIVWDGATWRNPSTGASV